jgi:copper resistance protein B
MVDRLEWRDGGSDPMAWKASAWAGYDLNKLWLKTEGEREDGHTESGELQLLYGRAISAYWDLKAGVRRDFMPKPERHWLALGVSGLAPWYIDVDATLFLGESGRSGLRLKLEHEMLFTQRVLLVPEIEINLHGKNDEDTGTGSGLSDIEAGLRLHYAVTRKIAPYLGLHWEKQYGDTADFARDEGEDTSETRWVAGISFWF